MQTYYRVKNVVLVVFCMLVYLLLTSLTAEAKWVTNKWDKKDQISSGDWTVVYGKEIDSQVFAEGGLVAYFGGPAAFKIWATNLVKDCIRQLSDGIKREFTAEAEQAAADFAQTVLQDFTTEGAESRSFGDIIVKAGVAQYIGHEALGNVRTGPNLISWQPYIAVKYVVPGSTPDSIAPTIEQENKWGEAARSVHKFCQQQGEQTGFPSGLDGMENGQRVIQAWCTKEAVLIHMPSTVNFQTSWGEAAREVHKFCQQQGGQTGFPSGLDGTENGQRVIQAWCTKEVVLIHMPSTINFQTNWVDAAREVHKFCQQQDYQTGFPSGLDGMENGQRVIQAWCTNAAVLIHMPYNVSLR